MLGDYHSATLDMPVIDAIVETENALPAAKPPTGYLHNFSTDNTSAGTGPIQILDDPLGGRDNARAGAH